MPEPQSLIPIPTADPVPQPSSPDVDCIIIGAGLSGLHAATSLSERGVSCLLLGARSRVGGKVYSKPVGSGLSYSEGGAAWLNPDTHPRLYVLQQKFGLDSIEQYREGLDVTRRTSGLVERTPSEGIFKLIDSGVLSKVVGELSVQAEKVDLYNIAGGNAGFEDTTLTQWAKDRGLIEGTDESAFLNFFSRSLLGVEASEVSALYFLDYIKSGMGVASLSGDHGGGAQHM